MKAETSEATNISPSPTPITQRCRAPGGDDRVRLIGVGEHQGEVAIETAQYREHRGGEVAGGLPCWYCWATMVDGDLGVGVAGHLHAGGFQLGAQRRVVLDDPVVHNGNLVGGVAMWMRVTIGRPAVSRPAGVADAAGPAQRFGVGGAQCGF